MGSWISYDYCVLAIEKALNFYDKKVLPPSWDKEDLLGSEYDDDDNEEIVEVRVTVMYQIMFLMELSV